MQVFMGWSGEASHDIAVILKEWLVGLMPNTDVFFSPTDIQKGKQWRVELCRGLREAQFGILCVTPDSTSSPWMLYEAGFLTCSDTCSAICALLFIVGVPDLPDALGDLQHVPYARDELWQLTRSINSVRQDVGEAALAQDWLKREFGRAWGGLDRQVRAALDRHYYTLRIVSATYGSVGKQEDVTQRMQDKIRDNTVRLRISAAVLGVDPDPGREKELFIEYTYGGRKKALRTPEGATLDLRPAEVPQEA